MTIVLTNIPSFQSLSSGFVAVRDWKSLLILAPVQKDEIQEKKDCKSENPRQNPPQLAYGGHT